MHRCGLSVATAILTLSAVQAHPSITLKAADGIKGALLFGAGDAVAQQLARGNGKAESQATTLVDSENPDEAGATSSVHLDSNRLVSASSIGSFYGFLLLPFVYQTAEAIFPGLTLRNVVLKTVYSCSILSTGGNYANLLARQLTSTPWIEDETFATRFQRCTSSVNAIFSSVVLADLRVWPLFDALCFTLVPPALRATSTSVLSVCWHTYVSWVAASQSNLQNSLQSDQQKPLVLA